MLLPLPPLPPLPTLLQSSYVLLSTTILLANAIPPLRRRFIPYGKTTLPPPLPATVPTPLDRLAALTVPHSFFTHFYIAGIASTLFWALQISTHGRIFALVAAHTPQEPAMHIEQVLLAIVCFLAQTGRRLYECLYIQKSSPTSTMWFAHYIVGLLFYVSMSLAVWISGTKAILEFTFTPSTLRALINAPSLKTLIGLLAFFLASGAQHDCHVHLAGLKKYSLPTHELFRGIVCPHYTAECVIYAAIAVVAAPERYVVNRTVVAGLGFVAVILGVSAKTNREWYRARFGEEAVRGKWAMVPGVF